MLRENKTRIIFLHYGCRFLAEIFKEKILKDIESLDFIDLSTYLEHKEVKRLYSRLKEYDTILLCMGSKTPLLKLLTSLLTLRNKKIVIIPSSKIVLEKLLRGITSFIINALFRILRSRNNQVILLSFSPSITDIIKKSFKGFNVFEIPIYHIIVEGGLREIIISDKPIIGFTITSSKDREEVESVLSELEELGLNIRIALLISPYRNIEYSCIKKPNTICVLLDEVEEAVKPLTLVASLTPVPWTNYAISASLSAGKPVIITKEHDIADYYEKSKLIIPVERRPISIANTILRILNNIEFYKKEALKLENLTIEENYAEKLKRILLD